MKRTTRSWLLLERCFVYRGALVPLALLPALLVPSADLSLASLILGTATAAAGLALRLAGVREIGGRARVHRAGARTLAVGGIYAWLRNPIYLGNALLLAAPLIIVRSPLAGLAGALALLAVYHAVVLREEAALGDSMGQRYLDYLAETSRWLPTWPDRPAHRAALRPTSLAQIVELERAPILFALVTPVWALLVPALRSLETAAGWRFSVVAGLLVVLVSLGLYLRIGRRLGRGSEARAASPAAPLVQGAER